jgi:hypothetical protein
VKRTPVKLFFEENQNLCATERRTLAHAPETLVDHQYQQPTAAQMKKG